MKNVILILFVLMSLSGSAPGQKFKSEAELVAKAREIHKRIIPIDAHVDVLLPSTSDYYYLPGRQSRTDVDKLKRGGIGAVAFAIAVSARGTGRGTQGSRRKTRGDPGVRRG